jgi:predicted Zn-dependent peptidase
MALNAPSPQATHRPGPVRRDGAVESVYVKERSIRLTGYQREEWERVRIHVLPTDRFKTYAISVYMGVPLALETVTPTALIPFVLRRGTKTLPETKAFRERLDDLYGAGFAFDVYKRGDYQIVSFRMDTIHDRYVRYAGSLLSDSLQYIGEAITEPALEDGVFRTKYVTSEKETLEKRIRSVINDKIRYAAERCLEEMFRGEPYGVHPLGRLEDLAAIDAASLHAHYRAWLETACIDIYVCGQTTMEEVKPLVQQYFRLPAGRPEAYRMQAAPSRGGAEPRTVVERMDVNQGKLNLGLRTSITYGDDLYPAALVFNGVFGGYPHSKLFMNVRERNSLAYYVSSRLDGHKGILTVQSDIEFAKFEQALAIIREQLDAMKRGDISDLEWNQTQAMIVNQLRELQDSAFELAAFDFNSVLSGRRRTADELIRDVLEVTPDDVRQVAERVELDTIYFLRNEEEA